MTVFQIIKTYLTAHGYHGLYHPGIPCGCWVSDLCPCAEPRLNWCRAGYEYTVSVDDEEAEYPPGTKVIGPRRNRADTSKAIGSMPELEEIEPYLEETK